MYLLVESLALDFKFIDIDLESLELSVKFIGVGLIFLNMEFALLIVPGEFVVGCLEGHKLVLPHLDGLR